MSDKGFDIKEAMKEITTDEIVKGTFNINNTGDPLFTGGGLKWDQQTAWNRLRYVRKVRANLKETVNKKELRKSMPSENQKLYEDIYFLLGRLEEKELEAIRYGE